MPYSDRFTDTDNVVTHISGAIGGIADIAILSSYAGFLSVSAVTVFELAIKDIFKDFATRKHNSFGVFVYNHFDRINGRIKLKDLKEEHVTSFGIKYKNRFKRLLDQKETASLIAGTGSILSSYGNLITCRHNFVHQGSPTLSINEVIRCYGLGKEVIHTLNQIMVR